MDFCKVDAVFDFFRRIAEIERNGESAGLQDAKVDRQPFQAVHEQDSYFIPFFDPLSEKKVGKTICFFIEYIPCDLPAVMGEGTGFHQFIFFPCDAAYFFDFRVDFYQTDILAPFFTVFF